MSDQLKKVIDTIFNTRLISLFDNELVQLFPLLATLSKEWHGIIYHDYLKIIEEDENKLYYCNNFLLCSGTEKDEKIPTRLSNFFILSKIASTTTLIKTDLVCQLWNNNLFYAFSEHVTNKNAITIRKFFNQCLDILLNDVQLSMIKELIKPGNNRTVMFYRFIEDLRNSHDISAWDVKIISSGYDIDEEYDRYETYIKESNTRRDITYSNLNKIGCSSITSKIIVTYIYDYFHREKLTNDIITRFYEKMTTMDFYEFINQLTRDEYSRIKQAFIFHMQQQYQSDGDDHRKIVETLKRCWTSFFRMHGYNHELTTKYHRLCYVVSTLLPYVHHGTSYMTLLTEALKIYLQSNDGKKNYHEKKKIRELTGNLNRYVGAPASTIKAIIGCDQSRKLKNHLDDYDNDVYSYPFSIALKKIQENMKIATSELNRIKKMDILDFTLYLSSYDCQQISETDFKLITKDFISRFTSDPPDDKTAYYIVIVINTVQSRTKDISHLRDDNDIVYKIVEYLKFIVNDIMVKLKVRNAFFRENNYWYPGSNDYTEFQTEFHLCIASIKEVIHHLGDIKTLDDVISEIIEMHQYNGTEKSSASSPSTTSIIDPPIMTNTEWVHSFNVSDNYSFM